MWSGGGPAKPAQAVCYKNNDPRGLEGLNIESLYVLEIRIREKQYPDHLIRRLAGNLSWYYSL